MKKCLIIAILFTITATTFAQKKLRFGIVGTPSLSWISLDVDEAAEKDGTKLGINFGLNLEYYFMENAGFATGLLINQTGGGIRYNDQVLFDQTHPLSTNIEVVYKLQYIQIPLGLKFKTNEIGYNTYFGQLGLNTMINTKSEGKHSDNAYTESQRDAKVNKDINAINLGYYIGAGFEYNLSGNTSLLVGINYFKGFTDLTDIKMVNGDSLNDKATLDGIELKIGVLF